MVEHNIGETPQPQDWQLEDDLTAGMIDLINRKHEQYAKLLVERIDALRKLRERVSLNSLIFNEFEAIEQPKLKAVPVFLNGSEECTALSLKVIRSIEADIARTEDLVQNLNKQKEAQVKRILDIFEEPFDLKDH
jgi:hypothetical protein